MSEALKEVRDVILTYLRDSVLREVLDRDPEAWAEGVALGVKRTTAFEYYEKNLSRSVLSNSRKQGRTRAAGNHRTPWTREEDEVLKDPKLTMVEKAEKLGRTYFAVESRHSKLTRNRGER